MSTMGQSSHSAESTPKTTGEYRNLINELLDVTEKGEVADRNAECIQRLLSRAVNVNVNDNKIKTVENERRKKHKRKHERDRDDSTSEGEIQEDSSPKKKHKKGKMCSGKVAKVDSIDIMRQVTYPHSKLNREFTQVKTFDELTLNLFVAGELETIVRCRHKDEKDARIKILLTNMYYSQFMDIDDIKDQYDVVMKQIERDKVEWNSELSDRLERALDRRLRLNDQK